MEPDKLKIVIHVAGVKYGGVRRKRGQEFSYQIFVGSEGMMPFADPDRHSHGKHSGCCPWTIAEMIRSGMVDHAVAGPGRAIDRLRKDSSFGRALLEAVRAIEAAIWQAYVRWKNGEDPVGHILAMCTIGRHRSYFIAICIWWANYS